MRPLSCLSLAVVALLAAGACKEQAPAPKVDSGLTQAMDLVARRCSVEVEAALVHCSGLEMRELSRGLVDAKQPRLDKLHTLASALSHADAKRRVVAVHLARNVYGQAFGAAAKAGAVHPETADLLIKALLELPPPLATRAAPVAAHAAALSGRGEALFATVNELPALEVRLEVYRAAMTHGRLAAFPEVQKLARADLEQVSAALASAAAMQNWSKEEQAEICPWVLGLTKHENPRVVDQAWSVLGACQAPEYQEPRRQRKGR